MFESQTTTDTDPQQPALPPRVPTRAQITAAEQANDAALNALQAQYGVQISEASLMGVRVQHLIDTLFGTGDERGRLMFDMTLAQRYAAEIQQAGANVRRQVIAQSTPGGLIIPTGAARRGRPVRDNPQA